MPKSVTTDTSSPLYAEHSPYRAKLDDYRVALDYAKANGDRDATARLRSLIDVQLDKLNSLS